MQSIELIRENLTNSAERVLSKIDDMREHCTVFPTPKGGCHTLWILGHMAFIEGLVIRKFMLGEANPLADWEERFDGSEVSGSASDYPPFDEVLAALRNTRKKTIELLDTLSEDDLDQASKNVPDAARQLFGTFRQCLQYVSDHWYMHRGQLADARRAAGVEKMWY